MVIAGAPRHRQIGVIAQRFIAGQLDRWEACISAMFQIEASGGDKFSRGTVQHVLLINIVAETIESKAPVIEQVRRKHMCMPNRDVLAPIEDVGSETWNVRALLCKSVELCSVLKTVAHKK